MPLEDNDLETLTDLAGILQRKQIIKLQKEGNDLQRQKEAILDLPQKRVCPWCGGDLPGEFVKCKYCASDISWVSGYPCKPGDEKTVLAYVESISVKEDPEYRKRLLEDLKNTQSRVVYCKTCGTRIPQCSMNFTVDSCVECNYKAGLGSKVSPEDAKKLQDPFGCMFTLTASALALIGSLVTLALIL